MLKNPEASVAELHFLRAAIVLWVAGVVAAVNGWHAAAAITGTVAIVSMLAAQHKRIRRER